MNEYDQRLCDQRHKEVEEVKQDVKDLKKSFDDFKISFNRWLVGLLTVAILNLLLSMMKGGVK